MPTIPELFCIPAFAIMDRMRGSQVGIGKTPEALIYGALVSLLLFGYSELYLNGLFAILFLAGSSLGWGQPIGWLISGKKSGNYEAWQIGGLQDSAHLAVIVRGYLWVLPTLPLVFIDIRVSYFAAAMPIAFYAAALISHYTVKAGIKYAWEAHECIRGGLLAILILLLKALS